MEVKQDGVDGVDGVDGRLSPFLEALAALSKCISSLPGPQ